MGDQGSAAQAVAAGRPVAMPVALGLLRALRPRQWTKNVLVLAAPAAAGVLNDASTVGTVALAFVALCLVSSGTYLLNDVWDAEVDRNHPSKRHRPIAAGIVSAELAVAVGVLLVALGLVTAIAVGWGFLGMVAGYVALTVTYTLVLKHQPVLDIAAVASGFIIRAMAGGVAVDVPLSRWFIIVASFGSLFMVAGKRHSEHLDLGDERAAARPILAQYSASYLHYVWAMASGVTVTAYCLWAFEQSEKGVGFPGYELSVIPFVMWVLRYALLLDSGNGNGGAPEDLVLGDRMLQFLSLGWAVLFGCGVYLDG